SGGLATTSQDDVTVANSVFIRCAAGVAARVQLPSSGGQDLSVSNSTFNECGFGIDCWALGVFFNQRTFTGLTMHDCATGIRMNEGGDPAYTAAILENSRLVRCQQGLDA